MDLPSDQFRRTLATQGYSLTRPRSLVFKALQDKDPLSMGALVKALAPQIDRASVYRTIALYEQLGIVHRIQTGWKYLLELSDSYQEHHHHMHCMRCGSVTAISEDPVLEERLRMIAAQNAFVPQTHAVEIKGICRKCQQA